MDAIIRRPGPAAGLLVLATLAAAADPTPPAEPRGDDALQLPPGFRAEVVYRVPREQGSWVSLCVDPKGRLIGSAQSGKLYRLTLPANGQPARAEPIPVELGGAQGLLCAFDSLYVVASRPKASGLYRVRDTDGDDRYDSVELLRKLDGDGEHGPHAVLLGPDEKSLYLVGGNGVRLPNPERSLVPRNWAEDALLPPVGQTDGLWSKETPGGWVCRTDPDGKTFELVAAGFRNPYDAAFNPAGELITYDSDMEWDMGVPWYRPTRVNHVTSGAEFGWRTGSNKWPDYYPDGLGSVVDIGPGSPTGMTFGTGVKFPAKYQHALFMGDWSYGQIYAVHLAPDGATYAGTPERFLAGSPLPVTDMVIHPDGALYLAVGGRGTASAVYRVTYHGTEPTTPAPPQLDPGAAARAERRRLEALHGGTDPKGLDIAWPYLSHADRSIRYAARLALEHIPDEVWQERALAEKDPRALTAAMIALARCGGRELQPKIVAALGRLNWDTLNEEARLDLLRAYALALTRMGEPSPEVRAEVLGRLDGRYPAGSWPLDCELCQLLVYLKAPKVIDRTLKLLASAPSQEEQIHYAVCLRVLKDGWSLPQRRDYFRWFARAAAARGGVSYDEYLGQVRKDARRHLTADEEKALADVLAEPPAADPVAELRKRPVVKEWTVAELLADVEAGPAGRDLDRGRKVYAAATCAKCHRFNRVGGMTGPDLTGAGGRFDARALLESIVEPSKVISDQYAASRIVDTNDRVIVGRIKDLTGDELVVMPDLFDPSALVKLKRGDVAEVAPAATSLMPAGLLNSFTRDEVLDLVAFLRSGAGTAGPRK
ncbi:MAG: c-type cytochrome [Gemmataceae bacterium]|nr:c-type cytochrome [Gemmataceae bacterium]